MSYALTVRAATRAAALEKLAADFDAKVLIPQPMHAHDRGAALATVKAFLDLLPEPPADRDVYLNVTGSLQWLGDVPAGGNPQFIGASVSCNACYVQRLPTP